MTATATAASVAAISSLAAYINAKYHIGQDLRILKFKKGAEKHYAELGACYKSSQKHLLTEHSTHKTTVPLVLLRSPCPEIRK